MVIGHVDGESIARAAQGPKSRAFHFSARMCSLCNGSRTQAADREFDRFHTLVLSLMEEGQEPSSVFSSLRYASGSEEYLNVFRYFAKLLCCHVAESCGPRPLTASEFAIGMTRQNIIFLKIDVDPTYEAYRDTFGEHKFAAHGGLIVSFDSDTQIPTSFGSSISLGEVRYIFGVSFGLTVALELREFHHQFWRKCEAAYQEAVKDPLTD